LSVVDVSTPDSPQVIGTVDAFPPGLFSIALEGDIALMTTSDSLFVVDVTQPDNPTRAACLATSGDANDVTVSGEYAYLAEDGVGLEVVDISIPTTPTIIGTVDIPFDGQDLAVHDDFAYVAGSLGSFFGLFVVDVSHPIAPELVGSARARSMARGVAAEGEFIYVGDHFAGLQVAWPQCPTAVAVFLASFNVRQRDSSVEIQWEVEAPCRPVQFRVLAQRGNEAREVPLQPAGPLSFLAVDRSPACLDGEDLTYSLYYRQGEPDWGLLAARTIRLGSLTAVTGLQVVRPNPFNPRTSASFSVDRLQRVHIGIYDLSGRLVRLLTDRAYGPGSYSATWDGSDSSGRVVSSGTYLVRMQTAGRVESRKVLLLR
jgi:hypothetical protein